MTSGMLYRARDDAFVGGVCSGIAKHYELDSIVVRILAVLLCGITLGIAGIVYIVLWARLPLEPDDRAPYEVLPESAESSAFGCVDCLQGLQAVREHEPVHNLPLLARLAIAAGLMLLFLAVAITVSPLVPGTQWWQFWPLIFLMLGLCLIIIPVRTRHEAAWHALGIVTTSLSASLLPMTLGMMSWSTIGCALERFWFIALLGVVLVVVGMTRRLDVLTLAGAFCIVAFCLVGLMFCVVPGDIEAFLLQMPSGRSYRIVFPAM